MVNNSAYGAAIKSLWQGKCTVTVRQNVTNEATGRTVPSEVDTLSDVPCRLVYKSISPVEQADSASTPAQRVTLLVDPAVDIPPGSKITVTQNGATEEYEQSGAPAVYSHHKEIPLELFKGWA
jgi:hypothetical protein